MKYMKKGIDNNLPQACIYPINNAKKEQLIEGKLNLKINFNEFLFS